MMDLKIFAEKIQKHKTLKTMFDILESLFEIDSKGQPYCHPFGVEPFKFLYPTSRNQYMHELLSSFVSANILTTEMDGVSRVYKINFERYFILLSIVNNWSVADYKEILHARLKDKLEDQFKNTSHSDNFMEAIKQKLKENFLPEKEVYKEE